MPYGLPWSEEFIRQLSDRKTRNEFVADQVRARISMMIRALREQEDRGWSQTELGRRAGKPQNVISRLENPDYGKPSLETLLEVAAAYDLPLFVDIPEWEEWFRRIGQVPSKGFHRRSFDEERMVAQAAAAAKTVEIGPVVSMDRFKAVSFGATSSADSGVTIQPVSSNRDVATKSGNISPWSDQLSIRMAG